MSNQLNEISAKLTASYLTKAKAERQKYGEMGDKDRQAVSDLHMKYVKRRFHDDNKADDKEVADIDAEKQKYVDSSYDNYKKANKRIWNIDSAERKLRNKFQAGNNPPPPESKKEDKPTTQQPDNSFGGKVRKIAQSAKSGLSSLKKRVFGEEYYEDLDYRYTVIPLLDSLMEGNSTDIKHAFNEAVAHRIENAMLHARLRIAEEIELNELNKSTLDSYVGKARYQARHAAGVANWQDGKTEKNSGAYRTDVVPGHKYSEKAKPWADRASKRYAGIEQAQRKGSNTKAVEDRAGNRWGYNEQAQLAELNKSTLDSYHRKAMYLANKTGAIANDTDKGALAKAGKKSGTNIPYDDFKYSPDAKRFADYSKKRFAGMAQARRKGATDGHAETPSGQTMTYGR